MNDDGAKDMTETSGGTAGWRDEDRALLAEEVGSGHAEILLARATPIDLRKDEVLLRDRGPADALYLLLEGRLSLTLEIDRHSIQIGELEAGNWVGLVALFSGSGMSSTTVAASRPSRLLRLPFGGFRAMIEEAPETACYLTHVLVPMLMHRLRVLTSDPILDPVGRLMMPGEMSLPRDARPHHEHGLAHFFKHLWGNG
jgi:CRP-like cAMP-binding protein